MKRFAMVLVALLALAIPVDAQQVDATLNVHTGVAFLLGPDVLTQEHGTGFNIGGSIDFEVNEWVDLRPSFIYGRFPVDEDGVWDALGIADPGIDIDGGAVSGVLLAADARLKIPTTDARTVPYFLGGIGFFRAAQSDVRFAYQGQSYEYNISTSDNAFGIHFGGGIAFGLSPSTSMFVESDVVIGMTEFDSTVALPVKVGVAFGL